MERILPKYIKCRERSEKGQVNEKRSGNGKNTSFRKQVFKV